MRTGYYKAETEFLTNGFSQGFDIGYNGPWERQSRARNIPFSIGNKFDLWAKIMKEVKGKRMAGPYDSIPFKNYIQSPVGLVPKAGNKTRMIFHLSFKFGEKDNQVSLNVGTPRDMCSVHYNDIDHAIQNCLETSKLAMELTGSPVIYIEKTDLSNAFRVLPLKICCFCWLVLMAQDPNDGKWKFFIDKCLPFGASISCSHYQRFSNSLKHIMEVRIGRRSLTNYLDDFLFAAITKLICDNMIQRFLELCKEINIPVSIEKTEWGTTMLVFLGILLDGARMVLSIPIEKQEKALRLLKDLDGKRKIMVKQAQVLTGYLNFLSRAIVAGRTFTRRIYSKFAHLSGDMRFSLGHYDGPTGIKKVLKPYHHVKIDAEMRFDCHVWKLFLENYREIAVCRPMIDSTKTLTAHDLRFYSDASAKDTLGFGAIFNNFWIAGQWEPGFVKNKNPSIEYLELYGLTAALLTWGHLLKNQRVQIYCDNTAVVAMINNSTSSCKNCMILIRLIVLNNLINNRRVFAKYVNTKLNDLADSLSRMQMERFWRLAPPTMSRVPSQVSPLIFPVSKIWQD